VFRGSEAFMQRHCASSGPPERLREVPRAQRRPLARPLGDFAHRYSDRRETMARAFETGVDSMQAIADYFGVHYSTLSRAMRRQEAGNGSAARLAPRQANA
jgi:hypothetical protein